VRVRQATIDRAALEHNFRQIQMRAPHSAILAMVKSNAYGHGLERVAQVLREADGFGVACVDEVERLRDADIRQTIVLMTGFHTQEELLCLQQLQATPVIHNDRQLDILSATDLSTPLPIWIKVDVGMGRLGFLPSEIATVLDRIRSLSSRVKLLGLMAHFSSADDLASSCTSQQLTIFQQLLQTHRLAGSLAHSAGIFGWPASLHDCVRPGITLYGVSPFADRTGLDLNLRPVMTLRSRLLAVHQLPKGSSVSYGGQFVCPETMPVGVVEMGYGDGYPRHAASGTPILIHGRRCALMGRVCMDMLMVDLRAAPTAVIGDEVVLWGEGLPIEEVAKCAETIGYELLCHVSQRVSVRL
jgi:alanine racemase